MSTESRVLRAGISAPPLGKVRFSVWEAQSCELGWLKDSVSKQTLTWGTRVTSSLISTLPSFCPRLSSPQNKDPFKMGPLCSPSKTPNGFPSNLGKSYILMVAFKSYGSHPGLPASGPLLPLFLLPEIPTPQNFSCCLPHFIQVSERSFLPSLFKIDFLSHPCHTLWLPCFTPIAVIIPDMLIIYVNVVCPLS